MYIKYIFTFEKQFTIGLYVSGGMVEIIDSISCDQQLVLFSLCVGLSCDLGDSNDNNITIL